MELLQSLYNPEPKIYVISSFPYQLNYAKSTLAFWGQDSSTWAQEDNSQANRPVICQEWAHRTEGVK
jgi:hypothetical protein